MINNKQILLFLKEAKEQELIVGKSDETLKRVLDKIEKTGNVELELEFSDLMQQIKIEYFNLGYAYRDVEEKEE